MATIVTKTRTILALAIAVIVLGIMLRLLGFFSIEVWVDESTWGRRAWLGQYGWLRPIGFMWLEKQIIGLYSSEQTLRLLSYVAGIAQLPLVWIALRRVTSSPWAALTGLFLLAVNPIAVAMTKEFKPYALESMLHTALALLAFWYVAKPSSVRAAVVVATTALLPLVSWSVVFAYPAVYGVVGLSALRGRRRADVAVVVVGVIVTFAVLGVLAYMRIRGHNVASEKWGERYDVFPDVGIEVGAAAWWYLEKTAEIAALPGRIDVVWPVWPRLSPVTQGIGAALVVTGIVGSVVRTRWMVLALFFSAWPIALAFNLARHWPYGVFRTNTFLVFTTCALAAIGVDVVIALLARRMAASPPVWRRAAIALAVSLAVYAFPWRIDHFAHKLKGTLTTEQGVLRAMRRLRELEGEAPPSAKRLLLLDGRACRNYRYYTEVHDGTRTELAAWFAERFDVTCGHYRSEEIWRALVETKRGQSFWAIIITKTMATTMKKVLGPQCTGPTLDQKFRGHTSIYRCDVPGSSPTAAIGNDAPANDDEAGDDAPGDDEAPDQPEP